MRTQAGRVAFPGQPSHDLDWVWFDDGAVVFDGRTGDTHALDRPLAELLKRWVSASAEDRSRMRADEPQPLTEQLASLGLI